MDRSVRYTVNGATVTEEARIGAGLVMVETDYQALTTETLEPPGYAATERRAYLNGMLILDPELSQWLADKAGLVSRPPHQSSSVGLYQCPICHGPSSGPGTCGKCLTGGRFPAGAAPGEGRPPAGDGNPPAEPSPEHPVYAKVPQDRPNGTTQLFMITCNEGWRSHIVATGLYEHVADWLLEILGRQPYAQGH